MNCVIIDFGRINIITIIYFRYISIITIITHGAASRVNVITIICFKYISIIMIITHGAAKMSILMCQKKLILNLTEKKSFMTVESRLHNGKILEERPKF